MHVLSNLVAEVIHVTPGVTHPILVQTFLLQIEGPTNCSRITRGFGFGSDMACVTDVSPIDLERKSGLA